MAIISTTALIIGAILLFMLGGFVRVSIMALVSVGRESREEADRADGYISQTQERRK